MLLNVDAKLLRAFMENNEDCSALSENEYIVDLYDTDQPVTLDILLKDSEVQLLAAARLLYDEEMDGWYMGEQIFGILCIILMCQNPLRLIYN